MNGIYTRTAQRQTWKTPKRIYSDLDDEFHFDFDPCPTNPNFDGLSCEWGKSNYVNPPYASKVIALWLSKCVEEARKGRTVVALIPVFADMSWWHEYIVPQSEEAIKPEIRWIRGRLNFDDKKGRPRFASCVVIWRAKS